MRPGKHVTLLYVVSLLCGGLLTSAAQGETLFVQAKTAHVRAGKTSLSPVVATVSFGEPLQLLNKEDGWLEVRTTAGVQGWIFANKLSVTKPANSDERLAAPGQGFRQTQASRVTASAGVRGLDTVSGDYARRSGISQQHRQAVDRMTNYRLTDREVEDFLRTGRLGEYAQ